MIVVVGKKEGVVVVGEVVVRGPLSLPPLDFFL